MSDVTEEVLQFITASFPSVWSLELLLVLRQANGPLARSELVAGLRASELVVSNALDALIAAGLASIEGNSAVFLPVNDDVRRRVDQAVELYRARPDAVRRAIVAAKASSATAFADSFKLRRDKND